MAALPRDDAFGATLGGVIDVDRPCSKCGYNLRGLRMGQRCPECGLPIRGGSAARFADNLVEAPMWYIRTLLGGFMLMGFALTGWVGWMVYVSVLSFQWRPLAPSVVAGGLFTAALVWLLGVVVSTVKRPITEHTLRDPVLDHRWIRHIARVCQVLPLIATGLGLAATFTTGATSGVLAGLGGLAATGSLFGLIPLSIYHASLADWAGDTAVGDRLRSAAWSLSVCGSIAVVCSLMLGIPGLPFKLLITVLLVVCGIVTFIGLCLLCMSVLQLGLAALWAVQNSTAARAREQRLAIRKAEEEERQLRRDEAAKARLAEQAEPVPLDNLPDPDDHGAIPLAAADDDTDDAADPAPSSGPSHPQPEPRGAPVRHRPETPDAELYELAPEQDFAEGR